MNKDIKKKWISALRSGEYKQAHHRLMRVRNEEKSYCCLGVLTDLFHKETGKGEWILKEIPNASAGIFKIGHFENETVLPLEVIEWAGLTSHSPQVGEHSLVEHNDGGDILEKDFIKIANLIQRHL